MIVDNHSSFSLMLSRENLKTGAGRRDRQGLDVDYDEVTARLKRFASRPRYQPIMIKDELTKGELAFVEAHRGDPTAFRRWS